jgi:hypothetical protein
MTYFIILLLCIVANEGLTELLSKSIFFSPLRNHLQLQSNKIFIFFSRAVECPYCSSVWTSMFLTLLVFIFYTPVLTDSIIVDSFLFLVIVHRCSNYLHDLSDRYFNKEYINKKE